MGFCFVKSLSSSEYGTSVILSIFNPPAKSTLAIFIDLNTPGVVMVMGRLFSFAKLIAPSSSSLSTDLGSIILLAITFLPEPTTSSINSLTTFHLL